MNTTLFIILVVVALLAGCFIGATVIITVLKAESRKDRRSMLTTSRAGTVNMPRTVSSTSTVSVERYDAGAIRKINDKGRVHIPADIRLMMQINDGDYVRFTIEDDRIICVKHKEDS